jgi:hypothetical protein
VSLEWLHIGDGHLERSLPRFLRQTESNDLYFGMLACVNEFLKRCTIDLQAARRNRRLIRVERMMEFA